MKNSRMENYRSTERKEEIIQIFVEDEKFSLNKNHLKKSSSFFNAMFSGRFAESNQNCIYLKGNLTQLKIIQKDSLLQNISQKTPSTYSSIIFLLVFYLQRFMLQRFQNYW